MTNLIAKYSAILLFILVNFIQCQTTKTTRHFRKEYKSIYIDQFKLTYVIKMLSKAYNNSNAINEIVKSDHSGFHELILTESDYKLIDSFTTLHNQGSVSV